MKKLILSLLILLAFINAFAQKNRLSLSSLVSPTGLGTGLGLSLSYDIIKAHGGDIMVEGKEGERSKFIVVLPLS
jgi:signal transduction histidine kinase